MTDRKAEIKSADMEKLMQYRAYLRSHPKLTYLFVELTDRCNLNCLHCGSRCEQGRGSFIDTDMLLKALEETAEDFDAHSVMVCLTGGEPLLHRDFYKIVQKIVRLGFPWGMTTNGTLIDGNCADRLKKLGLQSVTISLDGMEGTHEWLRRWRGSFRRTVDAVAHLHSVGIPVQITTVVHKKNFAELETLYEYLCTLKIASWRVINLEPIGRALDNRELLLSREEFTALLEFIRDKRFAKDTPMDVRFGCSHYLSYEYEHEVRDNYFLCGAGIYVASILCSGDICSCLDIPRIPALVQGNIAKDRLSHVWRTGFKEFREDRANLCEQCRSCSERQFCGGDSTHTWDYERNEPLFCFLRKDDIYA